MTESKASDHSQIYKKQENLTGILIVLLMSCVAAGSMYATMAAFLPIFVLERYNSYIPLNISGHKMGLHKHHYIQQVDTTMISYIIVSFDLSQMISSFIHAKTISKMGRKNAILIGFAIQIITLLGLSACAYIPQDYP